MQFDVAIAEDIWAANAGTGSVLKVADAKPATAPEHRAAARPR